MKKTESLPMHVQLFLPILNALRALGGSSTPSELKDKLIETLNISDAELEVKLKNGVYRIDNQITWSKVYLVRSGLLDTTDPDVLSLTEDGLSKTLTEEDVLTIFKNIHSGFVSHRGKNKKSKETAEEHTETAEEESHKIQLLEVLQVLSPEGFERLCQRLLRASGFKKVVVKGRSGDGGIDGEGILEINPLVSLKVIFQSKRYKD